MDEHELISGFTVKRWTVYELGTTRILRREAEAWLDIGGGGPVMPAEAGTSFPQAEPENLQQVMEQALAWYNDDEECAAFDRDWARTWPEWATMAEDLGLSREYF